ncbi:uncharacterized protein LOC130135797 isoform X1 [Syzygium oleosum]|uniref:uncharacterized protein LOC130135797 isoform X1 n=1 Tax=Syzygium oleosum TaxID=219896 RepID=UPI0024BA80CA|nr:uncharacterized protein LOC130135797 isoform X1 [Syzygium oleosum]
MKPHILSVISKISPARERFARPLARRSRPPPSPPPARPVASARRSRPPPSPPPARPVASAHPRATRPPVPTSAVASSSPRAAGSRALIAVASAAKPSSVLLPNGRGWGSGGGLFSADFVGLCCKSKRARRRLGISSSMGLPRLLLAGKPAPPSSVKACSISSGPAICRLLAASRLVSPGTSFRCGT